MKIFKQLAILTVTALLCGGVPAGPLDGISETGAKFEKEAGPEDEGSLDFRRIPEL